MWMVRTWSLTSIDPNLGNAGSMRKVVRMLDSILAGLVRLVRKFDNVSGSSRPVVFEPGYIRTRIACEMKCKEARPHYGNGICQVHVYPIPKPYHRLARRPCHATTNARRMQFPGQAKYGHTNASSPQIYYSTPKASKQAREPSSILYHMSTSISKHPHSHCPAQAHPHASYFPHRPLYTSPNSVAKTQI